MISARIPDATIAIPLNQLPQPPPIVDDTDSSNSSSDDGEHSIGRKRGVVPQDKVKEDGHGDRIKGDERPEDEDVSSTVLGVERVAEGWGAGGYLGRRSVGSGGSVPRER